MAECNKCGNCCENIWLSHTKAEMREKLRKWKDYPDDANVKTARFVLKHWKSIGRSKGDGNRHLFSCDMFDAQTRLCTAHDERPPVCSGFPWYGKDPQQKDSDPYLNKNCSYWADLPVSVQIKYRGEVYE